MDSRQYIFVNGVMKLNPAFKRPDATPTTLARPQEALAIVSSTNDILQANQAQQAALGRPMQLAESTQASIEIMQDAGYLAQFQNSQVQGGQIIDGLSNVFAKHEMPIGLINKLLALSEYDLDYLVDDSGSMSMESDVPISQADQFMRRKCDPQGVKANSYNNKLSRWQEAEDRLHIMIDLMKYLPLPSVKIRFLNRPDFIQLDHRGKTPDQFAQLAHDEVSRIFNTPPSGRTPLYKKVSEAFNMQQAQCIHYILTDGEPSDSSIEQMKALIIFRGQRPPQINAQTIAMIEERSRMHPVSLLSCTNEDAKWMKEIEEEALFVSETDDFVTESNEVLHDQGPSFPYSRGFHILCQMVAAINPIDLDALDESVPFTKQTLDNLMGRRLTREEYLQYFRTNPHYQQYAHQQQQFEREDIIAEQIVGKKNLMQGLHKYLGYNAPLGSLATQQIHYANAQPSAPPMYGSTGQGLPPTNPQWNGMPQSSMQQSPYAPQHSTQQWNSAPPSHFNQPNSFWGGSARPQQGQQPNTAPQQPTYPPRRGC